MDWKKDEHVKRYGNDCGHDLSYYQRYPVPVAAALWCGIPADKVAEVIADSHTVGEAILSCPYIQCLETKCRALHEAIDAGDLPVYREQGGAVIEHVAPRRRHVYRQELKEWIAARHPGQKPPALFDEIERNTHTAINADSFRALQADRDAARAELEKAGAWASEAIREMEAIRGERDSLLAMVDKANAPGGRSEKTYLNIIGGLLALMLGKSPAGKPQSSFENQGAIISAMLGHYGHIRGMGDSNLEKIMADANKTLKDSVISGG
jgi:hypothetical protein